MELLKKYLTVSCVVAGIGGVVASIMTGELSGLLIGLLWTTLAVIQPLAILRAIEEVEFHHEEQEELLSEIRDLKKKLTFYETAGGAKITLGKKKCVKCGKIVEVDRTSCPHCAGRDFSDDIG